MIEMKTKFFLSCVLNTLLVTVLANCFGAIKASAHLLWAIVPVFLLVNLFAGTWIPYIKNKTILICQHGTVLLHSFYCSVIFSAVYQTRLAFQMIPNDYLTFIWSVVVCFAVLFVVFWNGIICVYLTSTQLGLKLRIIGILCGMIPVVNLIVLFFILKTTTRECLLEAAKYRVNLQRKEQRICATKYPVLLVHGVFFRDSKYFNYWGRIPKELEANGAKVFYGNHSSAASIADSAAELKARIMDILNETGAEKLNIIAHSKGGLDCRYAIAKLGIGACVASLTTINTPHRGCLFADYLLTKLSADIKNKVANTYNTTLKKFGEASPDFLAAVNDLTDSHCSLLSGEMPAPDGIYCQSVGSVLNKAIQGKFPLNFSYLLVKHFSGANDGLVSETSFPWGEHYTLLKPPAKRGISHGDMIDLNRENIPGFDVREFYVQLLYDLKTRGL